MKTNNYLNIQHFIFPAAFIAIVISSCQSAKPEKEKDGEADRKPKYTLSFVQTTGPSSMIKLPGQLAAYQEVSIFPKVNGYVKNVLVDIGSKVHEGQLLMTLEAPELAQSTM